MAFIAFRDNSVSFNGVNYKDAWAYLAAITKLDIKDIKGFDFTYDKIGYQSFWRYIDIPNYKLTLKVKIRYYCLCGCGHHCTTFFFIQNGEQITFSKAMDIIHGEHKDRRKIIK